MPGKAGTTVALTLSEGASRRSKVVKALAAIDRSLKVEKEQLVIPWIKTAQAHTVFGLAILANAVFIGVDVELGIEGFNWPLWITESTFLVIFSVEIALRFWAERPRFRNYFDMWGTFDLAITLTGCIDAWIISVMFSDGAGGLASLNVLRMFRLVRLVRLVRVLRMFSELVVLVQTIGSSIMAVAWMSLLLFLVMYTGSIVTVMLIGQPHKAADPDVDKYFGSLSNALFTHFCIVTLENWPEIADAAMRHSQWWAVYFVGLIIFTNFALVNLMVGVIVQRIIILSREQETELASFAAESDQFRITLETLFNSMALTVDNEVSRSDIKSLLKKSETHEIMSAFGINLSIPAKTLYTIMDLDREGTTTFQEFFDACIRLCGSNQNVHSIFVQHDICKCRHDLQHRMGRIEQVVERLGRGCMTSAPPPEGPEADVRDLLERMDRLGQAQEKMLGDIADLAKMKAQALVGTGEPEPGSSRGAVQVGGSSPSSAPLAPKSFGAEVRRAAGREGSSDGRKQAGGPAEGGTPGTGGAASSRNRSRAGAPRVAGAGQALPRAEVLHRTGQEIGACCLVEPLFAVQPPRTADRALPEERSPSMPAVRSAWRQEQDLRAANRRELEAEYHSKRGVPVLS